MLGIDEQQSNLIWRLTKIEYRKQHQSCFGVLQRFIIEKQQQSCFCVLKRWVHTNSNQNYFDVLQKLSIEKNNTKAVLASYKDLL